VITALLADPLYKRHIPGPGHPERPARLDAVLSALDHAGLTIQMLRIPPRAATEDEVAACHSRKYIEVVKHDAAHGYEALSTGDTPLSAESLDIALQAAGGVLNAVDAVVERRAQNAFCAVRPPGHHATSDRGMGFASSITWPSRRATRSAGTASGAC